MKFSSCNDIKIQKSKNAFWNLGIIFSLALLFTTCFSPLDWNSNDTTLSVYIGGDNIGASRNPRNPSFFIYEVEFTGSGQSIKKTGNWGEPITVRIEPGIWNIIVRAIDPLYSDTINVAFGISNNIVVTAGQSNSTTIQMVFAVYEAIEEYLGWDLATGGTMDNPININLALELNDDNWWGILDALSSAPLTTFVNLNLFDCTPSNSSTGGGLRSDGSFDGRTINTVGGRDRVVSMTLPESTTSIAAGTVGGTTNNTFLGFTNLHNINLGNNITEIGNYAFWENQLTSVIIPNSVTTILYGGFYNNRLTSIIIPNSVTYIEPLVFANNQLENVIISNNIPNISRYAFYENRLTSIIIPNSVIIIGAYAFYNNLLTSVVIPNSVTTIEGQAFSDNKLTSVVIPNSVTTIGFNAFANNQLTSVIIPSNVTIIQEYAFSDNQLASVVIPNNVTTIEQYAFSDNKLTSIVIPNSVTTIGNQAFRNNELRSITIGGNVLITNNTINNTFIGNFGIVYIDNNRQAGTYTSVDGQSWTYAGP